MRLVGVGDSWCWGAELVDPIIDPEPIMNMPGGGFERQAIPENIEYRLKNRYINRFADMVGADELVDLSEPSLSNDAIVRVLMEYLSTEGYFTGRDTSDLFISIGWSSPERREFHTRKPWRHSATGFDDHKIAFGPWSMDQDHEGDEDLNRFFRLYFDKFWSESEFIHRHINQVWQMSKILKNYGIKFVMHQAFYHHHEKMIYDWDDEEYEKNFNKITPGDKALWEDIDSDTFIRDTTAWQHMLTKGTTEEVFIVFHPSAEGHKHWAEYLYQHCIENKLL